ncbi:MAG: His-Xaa-Ser system radical SAM maturase HxsB [Elusimicrobia bacterium]|nr:His-Xaa-Ser system radical SAM maturase HxsB [Elusimicrobiota bacterium]
MAGPKPSAAAAPFFVRRLGGKYLVTNEWGYHHFLSGRSFAKLRAGGLRPGSGEWEELQRKGFIGTHLDFQGLARDFRIKNNFLWSGPSLHIFVTTLRCNHACLYCQSSAVAGSRRGTNMSVKAARASVDMMFSGPSRNLTIEFQGGEPLLNWPVVSFVVRYARRRNESDSRNLTLSLVTNLTLMDSDKLDFLQEHEVSICASLDGPAALHDRNRPWGRKSSHAVALRWLREIERRRLAEAPPKRRIFKPSTLMTTSRYSLPFWRQIVDAHLDAGLEGVFLRPLSPIGYAKRVWGEIGYGAREYVDFYRRALDYILEINLRGRPFVERMAAMLAMKILRRNDPNFLDCRSPCGAGIGQLAYNYDGDVYTCDEGRMVAQQGDRSFRVGNVFTHTYQDLAASPAWRGCCLASLLDAQPACSRCAYKPYCGVCPVYNYEAQGSLWGCLPRNMHCQVFRGIFDLLFERLAVPRYRGVFASWLDRSRKEAPQ